MQLLTILIVYVYFMSSYIVSGYVVEFVRTDYTIDEGSEVVSVCLRVEAENIFEPTQATIAVATVEGTASSKQSL